MRNAELTYSDIGGVHSIDLDRGSTSIGRSPSQDLVLSEPCVSRKHAVIARTGDQYTVIDQGSTHGTFLNSVRVEQATLHFGDVLQMGSLSATKLIFRLVKNAESTVSATESPVAALLSSLTELQAHAKNKRSVASDLEKLNWLIRAARRLNEGAAREDVLTAFLHLTLQLTGLNRGYVFLVEKDELRLAQGLRADGSILAEDSTISRTAMQKAIESDAEFSITDTATHDKAFGWSSVITNRIRSIYCLPLWQRKLVKEPNQLLGLLYLDSHVDLKELTKLDRQLLKTVAAEAAALLHNALLAEAESKAREAREELGIAAKIHSGLMSHSLPKPAYAIITAKSIPCLAIGGDFYDAVELEDSVFVVIADVSGKGVPAAIVAATLQGIIHSQILSGVSLSEIAFVVNKFLCTRKIGKYATMILVKLSLDGQVEYVNCGHIPPLLLIDRGVRRLEESNLVVGLIPGASYASAHAVLAPNERILLATDGITEAENTTGQQFGDSGLCAIANQGDLSFILEQVANHHEPNPADDDCTLLEIKYLNCDENCVG